MLHEGRLAGPGLKVKSPECEVETEMRGCMVRLLFPTFYFPLPLCTFDLLLSTAARRASCVAGDALPSAFAEYPRVRVPQRHLERPPLRCADEMQ